MKFPAVLLSFLAVRVESVNFEDWHPPTPGDARSPCPGLNSLANHGILPRDGRSISVPFVVEKLGEALNVSAEVGTILGRAALRLSKDSSSGMFDLDDLKRHNAIEHDGSLSRKDYNLGGEEQNFCPEVFEETVGYYGNATEISLKEAAAARWGRIQSSRANNPNFTYPLPLRFNSYSESAIYMQVLQNATTGKASLDWIKILFSQERFPFAEGWRPINPVNGVNIASNILQLALFTPEKA